ncbi:hypothetical protein C2W64_04556 [Brevibacillus laterosporus]|nr:hypothetical protein C2W64_04556 [Brevibacillus laterosporus]
MEDYLIEIVLSVGGQYLTLTYILTQLKVGIFTKKGIQIFIYK